MKVLILIFSLGLFPPQALSADLVVCDEAKLLLKDVNVKINLALQPHWPQILKMPDQIKVESDETVRLTQAQIQTFAKTCYRRVHDMHESSHTPKSTCFDGRMEQMQFIVKIMFSEVKNCVDYHRAEIDSMRKILDEILKYVKLNGTYDFEKTWGLQSYCNSAIVDLRKHISELPQKLFMYIDQLKEKEKRLKKLFESCGRDRTTIMAKENDVVLDLTQECLLQESRRLSKSTTVSSIEPS